MAGLVYTWLASDVKPPLYSPKCWYHQETSKSRVYIVSPFLLLRLFSSAGAEYCDKHVCLSVCLSVWIHPLYTHVWNHGQNFTKFSVGMFLPVAVARSLSGGVAMRYVLPVWWLTSCCHIMDSIAACCMLSQQSRCSVVHVLTLCCAGLILIAWLRPYVSPSRKGCRAEFVMHHFLTLICSRVYRLPSVSVAPCNCMLHTFIIRCRRATCFRF